MRCAILLAVLTFLPPNLALASDARAVCPSPSADDYFFPSDAPHPKAKGLDEFRRQWYSKHLTAMSEPSLSCGVQTDVHAYRFTWLRTFHHPIAIRVSMGAGAATVIGIELDGAGGYKPGAVKRRIEKPITDTEWKSLLGGLNRAGFWQASSRVKFGGGLDGAQWIFEGRRNGRYQVVDRWSPEGGPYYSLGRIFLNLAGFLPIAHELY